MRTGSRAEASSKEDLAITLQFWAIGAIVPMAFILFAPLERLDFYVFWIAGKMALTGGASQVYDPVAARAIAASIGFSDASVFPYPPHTLILFAPLALLPPLPALFLWNISTAVFFLWAARPWLPKRFPSILVLLSPAALICLDFGQTGLLYGGLWLLAFRGWGSCAGLLSFKPHISALSIFTLRSPAPLMAAVFALLLAVLVTSVVFGPNVWIEFVHHSIGHAAEMGARKRWLFGGVTPALAYHWWGWASFGLAGVLLLARNFNVFTAATAAFLVSPYGFHYDMTVACAGLGLLIAKEWRSMPLARRIPVALGFLSPVISLIGAWWVPPILLWTLWAQSKYPIKLNGQERFTA